MHVEVPIRVTAWVDEGIAPLVLAMNRFEEVVTLDSCQGDEKSSLKANVFFAHRRASELVPFIERLSAALRKDIADGGYVFRLEWSHGGDRPLASFHLDSRLIAGVSEALVRLHEAGGVR